MGFHRVDETHGFSDMSYDDDVGDLGNMTDSEHKKRVRKLLEEHLEKKRLKEELYDELEGEFDWDDTDKD